MAPFLFSYGYDHDLFEKVNLFVIVK